MWFSKKFLIFYPLIFVLWGCNSLNSMITTSTPVFPLPDQFEELPTLGVAIPPTPTPRISATPESQASLTVTARPSLTPTGNTTTKVQQIPPDYAQLAESINQITTQAGGRWHIVIKQVGGSTLFTSLPEQRINIASLVKVPLAFLFFKAIESKGVSENQLQDYIQSTGTGGRTFDQLLRAMLVKSEEDATEILNTYIRSFFNVPTQMVNWELSGMDLDARRYTATGVASMFERFYQGDFISPTARELILSYLSEYTPNDELRIGVLSELLTDDFTIYNKRGSLLTPYVVADCAILEDREGADYVIILLAYQGEPETTYEILEQALGEIALAFWQAINTKNQP